MACNNCGACRYSNASTATVSEKITSGGMEEDCRPDMETLYSGLPYASPGVWQTTYSNGNTVNVRSMCVSGGWTWSQSNPPPSPRDPHCPENVGEETVQTLQNNCAGFHSISLTAYIDGSWMKLQTTITVNNNQECES